MTTRDSLPVAVAMGPGNAHEGRKLIPIMESIGIKHGKGRPRKRPNVLYADTKYNIASQQVLPGRKEHQVTDAGAVDKEEKAWETEGLR